MIEIDSTVVLVCISVLAVSLIVQVCYYLFFFSRLSFYKPVVVPQEPQPVSVIVCARNESANLRKYLYAVLEQAYHEFEVIVVNDCSWDETGDVLKEIAAGYSRLKIITVAEQEKYEHGKKFAVMLGIKAATHNLLLFTDADCMPAGKNWLTNMQNHFTPRTDIVLGYGAYIKRKGLLNKVIRYDAFYNAMTYLSFALAGTPYMGVGRNLAYRKELFFKNKGFANHYHILSGDDDLFVNETAASGNTAIEIQPGSFTFSEPKHTFRQWFRQKRRHASTGKMYKFRHRLLLGTMFLFHFLFYAALIALCATGFDWRIIIGVYFFRLSLQMLIFGKSMKRLSETDLLLFIPVFDFSMLVFYPILALSTLLHRNAVWK